jgi:two-component system KDP operon response regulator KdpE
MLKDRILVVDDEPKLVQLIKEVLSTLEYHVIATSQGKQAVEMVALENPDLMILDIVLPGKMDGYEVARRVREFSSIPIIMLTAKAREVDLLQGFETGADDYLTKPFSSKELVARVRALLKRVRSEGVAVAGGKIECGDLHIDLARRRVLLAEEEVGLTRTEYELLCELAKHRNQVLTHEQLLTAVWGQEYRNDVDYLRAYIHYLRKKLEREPLAPEMIVTSHGVGYMLSCSQDN